MRLPLNLGIGGAEQTGFLFAMRHDYDIVVRMDADGQHPPDQVSVLVQALAESTADAVIGSRFLGMTTFRSTFMRRIGIRWLAAICGLLVRQPITDSTSGFRAYRRPVVAFLAQHNPYDYPEPEGVILLIKNGFRVQEVPVVMRARQEGQSSIRGLKTVYYMLKVTLSLILAASRRPVRSRASGVAEK